MTDGKLMDPSSERVVTSSGKCSAIPTWYVRERLRRNTRAGGG